ncbi:hypothetical protein Poli38472_008382 [Pythium oligandrum]|uniref:PX domain-containing protein n=1 Tax=Pythium oligandrum TaxID=41045 RepID=A0A8K1CM05_PYTOL|nr:hypothetical protein Poli38472_008382 [Pythium oligandrum]|eukprot:TMW65740.1 hypothetical protein Poli38472_008382 [Pythium oligandrum]
MNNSRPRSSLRQSMRVTVRDITAILSVEIRVDGFQYDSSIMEHPEFMLTTIVVFQCRQHGGKQMETQWKIYRTFQEFVGLDSQLRQRFPTEMTLITPPRPHRRRTFFRLHRTKAFLNKRCHELNAYLSSVLDTSSMRLTRFMDPRAPLVLRCFCNFDAGFGRKLVVRQNQLDSCVLCLDALPVRRVSMDEDMSLEMLRHVSDDLFFDEDCGVSPEHALPIENTHQEFKQQQILRQQRRSQHQRPGSKFDELEANLLDDHARNLVMCSRYECSCRRMSFQVTGNTMRRILQLHGCRQIYRPVEESVSALFCVLFRLQQFNDLDKKLYDILTEYSNDKSPMRATTSSSDDEEPCEDAQLSAGVELLREALANYGLLYVRRLESHFRTSAVDLKKKLHEFKNDQHHRVGALELVLLSTMLDLSITLITNDHSGTIQEIFPLPNLPPIRNGGRLALTLGYILPNMYCVNGMYVLGEPLDTQPEAEQPAPSMWLGLEELDRCFMALVEREMQSDLSTLDCFDQNVAETLNKAILDAVWNDCHHNPNLFHLFQRQARQFGNGRTTANFFFQYLELAFGVDGATYLVDFLLHVLPERSLREKLLRARWMRVHRHLAKRVTSILITK